MESPKSVWAFICNEIFRSTSVPKWKHFILIQSNKYYNWHSHRLRRSLTVSSNFLNDQVRIRKIQFLGAISSSGDGQPGQGGTTQWKECISYTTSTWVNRFRPIFEQLNKFYFKILVCHLLLELCTFVNSSTRNPSSMQWKSLKI